MYCHSNHEIVPSRLQYVVTQKAESNDVSDYYYLYIVAKHLSNKIY